ncbi:MAG: serine hydrolase domain-containing protein, partial [Ignavibacteriales bacterium]
EAGHMRLDAPVNLYLPQSLQVPDQGFDEPVRLRHLMTHTAGFEDRALGQLFERDYDRVRPLQVYLRQERPQRVRAPGRGESYSNYGAALAGMAVSNVTGKTFEALSEDEIINPLQLTRTTFREPHPEKAGLPHPMNPALARDVADGFRWTANGFERRPFEYVGQIAPAGSASSTAGDMARYMQLLLNGGTLDGATVFSPQIARWMRTSLYRPAPGATGWNYGFEELALPGGHRGFGHLGTTLSFMSSMVLAPDLGLGIFVSTNTDTGAQLRERLPQQIIEHFYAPAATIPPGSPSLVDKAGVYEGHYLTTRRAYGGMEGFVDALIGFTNVRVTPGGYLSTTDNEGVHLWAATAKPGVFRSLDGPETIVFDIRNGRAVRIFGASGTAAYERRGDWAGPNLLALLAGLTAVASIATLIGVGFRSRRDFRQTTVQARASLMQTTQAILWLIAMGCFATWAAGTADTAHVVYDWPGPWIVIASACALVASVLAIMTLIMLPVIWRGGRRVDSWTGGRKFAFTVTVLIFSALALDLAYWGALMPWSG